MSPVYKTKHVSLSIRNSIYISVKKEKWARAGVPWLISRTVYKSTMDHGPLYELSLVQK